jgi:hypothetical protein
MGIGKEFFYEKRHIFTKYTKSMGLTHSLQNLYTGSPITGVAQRAANSSLLQPTQEDLFLLC